MGLMARMAGRLKAALVPGLHAPAEGGGGILPEVAAFMQISRIGGKLTPAILSGLILAADSGRVRRLVDLANEARQKDGHLQSVLWTRESALNTLPWVIQPAVRPGKDVPTSRDKRIAAFVQSALMQVKPSPRRHGLRDAIAHLNGAVFFGFSVVEVNWHKVDGKIVPKEFKLVAPRRFEFSRTNGHLLWRDPGMAEGVDLQEEYPSKFIIHQPRITGDAPHREGLMRVMLWLALFRSWTISDWLKLAELSWKPWRIGSYKQGSGKENRTTVEGILRALGSSGMAAHSDNVNLDIKFPEGGGGTNGNHISLAQFLGSEMSKGTLGQTLTTDQGNVGTQALGKVHNEVRKDIRDSDAMSVSETLMRDLIAWIVHVNFGDVPLPSFRFVTEDRMDLENFGTGVGELVDRGLEVPLSWLREEVGIPPRKNDEPILTPIAQVEADANDEPDGGDGGDDPKEGEDDDDDSKDMKAAA